MGNFKTVFEFGQAEDIIEKSRFIAYCQPIETESEAIAFIEKIKKKHWDATHNVPVYVLGENYNVQRYSDDGEPSGTAGVPILSMLKNEGITNLVVVVTRYFGGVKLGTGGLVRAYTHTAKLGVEAAKLVERVVYSFLKIRVSYHLHGKVQNYLMGESDFILEDTAFLQDVTISLFVLPDQVTKVSEKLTDICNGQIEIEDLGEAYLLVHEGKILDKKLIE